MRKLTVSDILPDYQEKVSKQSYSIKDTIDGVKIIDRPIFSTQDGMFEEIVRLSEDGSFPELPDFKPLQVNRSVLLPGSIQDVADLLDASKLVVFSSMNEGVPNGVLEGMAHGLAIVATDIPGIREALGDLADGQVVEASNPSKFAHRIINLMTNENLRLSLGHKNKCRIETAYIIESMVEKTLNVFK